jgi:hypothetical protein
VQSTSFPGPHVFDHAHAHELLKGGDLTAAMLYVVAAWARAYHPDAEYAYVGAHLGLGVPDVSEPVTLRSLPGFSASASSN